MDFYKNRGGRIVTLNTNSKEVIEAIKAGEFTLVEDVAVVTAPVKKVAVAPVKLDKKELTAEYVLRFGKRPFAGWSAEKLTEKLAE